MGVALCTEAYVYIQISISFSFYRKQKKSICNIVYLYLARNKINILLTLLSLESLILQMMTIVLPNSANMPRTQTLTLSTKFDIRS